MVIYVKFIKVIYTHVLACPNAKSVQQLFVAYVPFSRITIVAHKAHIFLITRPNMFQPISACYNVFCEHVFYLASDVRAKQSYLSVGRYKMDVKKAESEARKSK